MPQLFEEASLGLIIGGGTDVDEQDDKEIGSGEAVWMGQRMGATEDEGWCSWGIIPSFKGQSVKTRMNYQ